MLQSIKKFVRASLFLSGNPSLLPAITSSFNSGPNSFVSLFKRTIHLDRMETQVLKTEEASSRRTLAALHF